MLVVWQKCGKTAGAAPDARRVAGMRLLLVVVPAVWSLPFLETTTPAETCVPDPLARVPPALRPAVADASAALAAETAWTLGGEDAARFARAGDATFGFTAVDGVAAMLAAAPRARTFVDLGSGAGHAVLYAAVLAPGLEAVGVELSAERTDAARRALARADAARPELRLAARVNFTRGDMLAADVARADVVWASTLALGDGLRAALARKLASELREGAVLFSSAKLFEGDARPLVVANSWSAAHEAEVAVVGARPPRVARRLVPFLEGDAGT